MKIDDIKDNFDTGSIASKGGVIDLQELKDTIYQSFKHGQNKGELTHFPPVDSKKMFTWKKGLLYCFTGHSQHGKSEFLNYLTMLKSINDGWKWTIYSPESYPVSDFVETLIHMYIGKSVNPFYANQMSEKELWKGFDWVKNHYRIIDFDSLDLISYKDVFEHVKNSDGVIIDPFNYLKKEQMQYADNLMEVLSGSKKYASRQPVALIYVEHPNNTGAVDDQTGEVKEPNEFNLNGGAMWRNKVDVIAIVHRPFITDRNDTSVTFRTKKIKNQKLHGIPDVITVHFDRAKNRYLYLNDIQGGRLIDCMEFNNEEPSIWDVSINEDEILW